MHPSTYDQHCGTGRVDSGDRQLLRPAIWLMLAALIAMLVSAWDQGGSPATDSYNFLGERHDKRSDIPLPSYARVADPALGGHPAITDE